MNVIDESAMKIIAGRISENLSRAVKTVNGVPPDYTGNVNVEGGVDGGGGEAVLDGIDQILEIISGGTGGMGKLADKQTLDAVDSGVKDVISTLRKLDTLGATDDAMNAKLNVILDIVAGGVDSGGIPVNTFSGTAGESYLKGTGVKCVNPFGWLDIIAKMDAHEITDAGAASGTSPINRFAVSPQGDMLVTLCAGTSSIRLFKLNGDSVVTLPNLPGTLNSGAPDCLWSPNGMYLFVLNNTAAAGVFIYRRRGDAFERMPDPVTKPTAAPTAFSITPDGGLLVIGLNTTPFMYAYRIEYGEANITLTPAPEMIHGIPSGAVQARAMDISADGRWLAMGIGASPYYHIYAVDASSITQQSPAGALPPGAITAAAFDRHSTSAAMGHATSPFQLVTLKLGEDGTWARSASPAISPTSSVRSIRYSLTDDLLVVGFDATPFFIFYQMSNGEYLKLANPYSLPTGAIHAITFANGGDDLYLGQASTPWVRKYVKRSVRGVTSRLEMSEANLFEFFKWVGLGKMKSDVVVGGMADVELFTQD